jgi:hypothetical protein
MADLELIQFRRGTSAKRANYVLADGEPGWDGDALYVGDGVTPGGLPAAGAGGGLTQSVADARYVKLSQINAANGVAGLDATSLLAESQLPLPAVDLTVLFNNKLA